MRIEVRTAAAAVGMLLAVLAGPLDGQRRTVDARPAEPGQASELTRLREAAARETAGDFAAAEAMVAGVLESNPQSLTALLSLERVLKLQGRLPDIAPAVDRLLALDPVSVIGHQLRLRVHDETNDERRLDAAVRAWVAASPRIETPYREGALVWRRRGEHARAVKLLEQGRSRIDRPDALALELGDVHAAAGDHRKAAAEWSRAVGAEGRGFLLVQRRLQQLPDGGASVIPVLADLLGAAPLHPARQKAATLLAIEAGMERRATRLAAELGTITPAAERDGMYVELARRADAAGLYGLAAWSYGQLLERSPDAAAALAIRTRIAELALLAGDTTLATATYRQLEQAAALGSPQRRQALALRIQLVAREGDLASATDDLQQFRVEFPQASELDATANAVAQRWIEHGDDAAAEHVLTGVHGPLSARTRGRLLLRRGEIERARDELLGAAPLLRGAEATEAIALAALLVRISPQGGELVTNVSAAADEDRAATIREAARQARGLAAAERAAILDFLAASADRSGLAEDADALRHLIVEEAPRSHEAPAALLALALRASAGTGRDEEAIVLLERLILEYPRSALLPRARSELQRIGSTSTR
jgi:tetratricopeptide (TPR) repeat protein